MTRYLLILVLLAVPLYAAARPGLCAESGEPRSTTAAEHNTLAAIKTLAGFRAELVYAVPPEQGSWVSMCVDPRGRLVVCDQYGALYRVTPPPLSTMTDEAEEPLRPPLPQPKVEKINIDLGEAQGLLWAFDSLYVVVNRGDQYESGLSVSAAIASTIAAGQWDRI